MVRIQMIKLFVYIDTTVREKNITHPTYDKLPKKVIKRCRKILPRTSWSYARVTGNHPRNKGKVRRADKKVRTIAGRLVRDLERKLTNRIDAYRDKLDLDKRVLVQKKNDKDKIYSLHEVDVRCISKGKEHKQC